MAAANDLPISQKEVVELSVHMYIKKILFAFLKARKIHSAGKWSASLDEVDKLDAFSAELPNTWI